MAFRIFPLKKLCWYLTTIKIPNKFFSASSQYSRYKSLKINLSKTNTMTNTADNRKLLIATIALEKNQGYIKISLKPVTYFLSQVVTYVDNIHTHLSTKLLIALYSSNLIWSKPWAAWIFVSDLAGRSWYKQGWDCPCSKVIKYVV